MILNEDDFETITTPKYQGQSKNIIFHRPKIYISSPEKNNNDNHSLDSKLKVPKNKSSPMNGVMIFGIVMLVLVIFLIIAVVIILSVGMLGSKSPFVNATPPKESKNK